MNNFSVIFLADNGEYFLQCRGAVVLDGFQGPVLLVVLAAIILAAIVAPVIAPIIPAAIIPAAIVSAAIISAAIISAAIISASLSTAIATVFGIGKALWQGEATCQHEP